MNTTELVVGMRLEKKIQARTVFEPMTSAIPVQRYTNWANKPTGFNLDSNKPSKWWMMTGNRWKSYMCTAVKKWDISDPCNYEHYWTSSWNETWYISYFSSSERPIFYYIIWYFSAANVFEKKTKSFDGQLQN